MEVYQSSRTAAELEYALGAIPSIGANNHWFIGDQDTGIIARGQTPFVGDNGNWWVGETDTGTFAGGIDVTGAEVGQTIQVTAVDENGRPAAWEAVKFPESGIPEPLADIVLEEETVSIEIAEDINGNPFEAKELLYYIDTVTNCSKGGYFRMYFRKSPDSITATDPAVTYGGCGDGKRYETWGRVCVTSTNQVLATEHVARNGVYAGTATEVAPYGTNEPKGDGTLDAIRRIDFYIGMTYPAGTIIKFYKVR